MRPTFPPRPRRTTKSATKRQTKRCGWTDYSPQTPSKPATPFSEHTTIIDLAEKTMQSDCVVFESFYFQLLVCYCFIRLFFLLSKLMS